jgi:8-oxo-dGTP pyrophosphatase MutT (NUDIX family)
MPATDEPAPWQIVSRNVIYSSQWGIDVGLWSVRLPDGRIAKDHPVLEHLRPAVGILPIGDDGRILMVDHYRVITGRRGWELPAGRVDPGETVEQTAQRELLEETGYSAGAWATLGQYHPSNGSSNQVFHVKIARKLIHHGEPTDRNETMGLCWFDVQQIRQLVHANEIYDGLSLTAICWAFVLGIMAMPEEARERVDEDVDHSLTTAAASRAPRAPVERGGPGAAFNTAPTTSPAPPSAPPPASRARRGRTS